VLSVWRRSNPRESKMIYGMSGIGQCLDPVVAEAITPFHDPETGAVHVVRVFCYWPQRPLVF
jgi:hypothetical protein